MSSAPAGPPPFDRHRPVPSAASSTIFKSGPLYISSKGIGWKSWKRRWFILTRTSLVFFKSDPCTLPQRGGDVNLTLGGIDLNNSGSVVVREDKKLLTVLFPDGRDGRAFTLKAETSEDLFEWKTALEQALSQAPNAALVMGHNGIFRNDTFDPYEGAIPQWKDRRMVKSLVVGRPILLALEDIDGKPSFLEKALRFIEKYGVKVEGILRQAADVEEVDRRLHEYEQGRSEFAPEEDAHVVSDCVKHILRELPSSPVPASCCTALLEAFRLGSKDAQIKAMRSAILETFPEPNRNLLQRILKMMHTVASHTSDNRMTPSAVAACMAPLLLRPLLAGECELEDDFDMAGDHSSQLLAAANAANNAQAIVATLVEEYINIFDEDNLRVSLSPNSPIQDSTSEESVDDEAANVKDNGFHDAENDVDPDLDDVSCEMRMLSGKLSESSGCVGSDLYEYKVIDGDDSDVGPTPTGFGEAAEDINGKQGSRTGFIPNGSAKIEKLPTENGASKLISNLDATMSMGEILSSLDSSISVTAQGIDYCVDRYPSKINGSSSQLKHGSFWVRSNARRGRQADSVDSSSEEELAIQRLEMTKNDLQIRIDKEARGNAILQASLERRKQALHERRIALEQDVSRLQEQLQAERDLRAALEVGLSMSSGQFSGPHAMDLKTRAELEEIALAEADVARLKQKVAELHLQLNHQRQHQHGSLDTNGCYQHLPAHMSHPKFIQHGFDRTLAFCTHERKQKSEDSSDGGSSHWSTVKQSLLPNTPKSSLLHKYSSDARSSGLRGLVASSTSMHPECSPMTTFEAPKLSDALENSKLLLPSSLPASSTLVELTTRLDFFKERRSQLMEQLQNLDLANGAASNGYAYKSTSPP